MNKNITNFDYILFLAVTTLTTLGILFIYSSGINSEGVLTSLEYRKQIIWAVTGLILMTILMLVDYVKIKDRIPIIYIIGVLILIYTILFGKYSHGAKSWIGIGSLGIQPSEFMKIIYILYLAYYLEKSKKENPLKRFIKAGIIALIPMGLILAQPDLGTASVYIPVFIFMVFMAGLPLRYIGFIVLMLGGSVTLILLPIWEELIAKRTTFISTILTSTSYTLILFFIFLLVAVVSFVGYIFFKRKYYYWLGYIFSIFAVSMLGTVAGHKVLKQYQMMRLIVFLDPSVDALGSGWNITQSLLAIGSGGLKGMGYLNGIQSHYKFLPEQSTDFIFSILSEEFGFIGGILVFGVYCIVFLRMISTFKNCEDLYGKLIATGILGMFFYHFIINIGMVMGIMPIMGIPLLFLSYGGSSLWSAMLSIGVLMGINLRQI